MTGFPLYLQDGALVGTPALLESENVAFPAALNLKNIPVPSVYKDARGEIHNFQIPKHKFRFNILYTKAGVMRSGDIHQGAGIPALLISHHTQM
jgi:hypothetical protein